jgi:hypothetical protein
VEAPLDVSVPETAPRRAGARLARVVGRRRAIDRQLSDNAEHAGAIANVVPPMIENGTAGT